MTRHQLERIYGMRELTRILTLTPRRTAQLRRLELLHGESGYTFRDLLALRAASALLDAGASVRQIRQALAALRRQDPRLEQPLAELKLVLEGDRLLAQSDRVRFDPRSGQLVLALDEGGLEKAASATLAMGLVRPLAPPLEQAETWFERASEWDGDPARWEDAIEAYQRVVTIDPKYAAAWNNLGLLLHRLGRYDEGEAAYRSALAHDPRCREAAYNLGSLHEDRGFTEEAIADYRRALEVSPDYADAHFNLAGALVRVERGAEAVRHWQRYLELDAGSPGGGPATECRGCAGRWNEGRRDGTQPGRTCRRPATECRGRAGRWNEERRDGTQPGRTCRRPATECRGRAGAAPMRMLIVGGGGREHALAWKIAQSPRVTALFTAPGNPGIARHAVCVPLTADALGGLVAFAPRERIDLTVVGPEAPLVAGLADRLLDAGLAVFGPIAQAAAIEGSKAFAKDLMARNAIPTARFATFDDPARARGYCREVGPPLVVKADGLAGGKGAIVCRTLADADEAVAECMERAAC